MSNRWRGVVAALLNPDLRAALAELWHDPGLTDARRRRALERLDQLGLLRRDGPTAVFDETALRDMLAEDPPPKPTGPHRWLRSDGRIDRYPASTVDERELLAWVAERVLAPGEVITERQMNERLEPYTDDVAVLRRRLFDHGLVERTRSGSQYARSASDA